MPRCYRTSFGQPTTAQVIAAVVAEEAPAAAEMAAGHVAAVVKTALAIGPARAQRRPVSNPPVTPQARRVADRRKARGGIVGPVGLIALPKHPCPRWPAPMLPLPSWMRLRRSAGAVGVAAAVARDSRTERPQHTGRWASANSAGP